jgi:hypothetical protein
MSVDSRVASSCQLQAEEFGRHGLTQVADQVAVKGEPKIDALIMVAQPVSGADKFADVTG